MPHIKPIHQLSPSNRERPRSIASLRKRAALAEPPPQLPANWGVVPGKTDPNFVAPNPQEHLPSMEDIRAAESSDEAYRLGVMRRGWLAARRGKERVNPYVPGAYHDAWFAGFDQFKKT